MTRTPAPSAVASASARDRQRAATVHRVDGVVDEVRPHLVQLGAVGLDRWQVVGDLGVHLDVAETVTQDDERLLQTDANVDPPDRRLVEVGVALDRPDDIADPGEGDLQLPEQLADRCIRGQPRDDVHGLLAQAGCGPAGLDEGAGRIGAAGDGLDLADPVGPIQGAARRGRVGRRAWRRARPRRGLGDAHRLLECGDRAERGCGRVVELMRKAGGQGPERGELLAFMEGGLHRPQTRDGGPNDRDRHVRPGGEQLAHRVDRDAQHLGGPGGRDRRHARATLECRDLALQRSRADDGDGQSALAGLPGHLELAVEHHEQRVGGVALADEHLAGLEVDDLAACHELAEWRLVDVGEERRLPQAGDDLVDGEMGVGHSCAR